MTSDVFLAVIVIAALTTMLGVDLVGVGRCGAPRARMDMAAPDAGVGSVRSTAAWVAEHDLLLLAFIVPVLVIAPSSLIASWLVGLALLLVPIPFLARRLAYGRFSVRTPQDTPLILLLVMHVVTVGVTSDMGLTFLVLKRTLLSLTIFYFLVNAIHRQEQVVWLATMLVAVGLAMAGLGLIGTRPAGDKYLFLQELIHRLPHVAFPAIDVEGIGFHPNIVGGSLSMILPVNLALLSTGRGLARVFYGVVCAFLLIGIFLSQSRGALVGVAAAIWLMAVIADRRLLWLAPLAGAAVGVALLLFSQQADLLFRMDTLWNSVTSRLDVWQEATSAIRDSPFIGIGAGTFSLRMPSPHAHQIYLQAAVDFGLPGFCAFIVLLTTLSQVAVANIRRNEQSARRLAVGLLGGFVVYLVHGLVDDITFSTKAAAVLWTILGLMVAQWRLVHSAEEQATL